MGAKYLAGMGAKATQQNSDRRQVSLADWQIKAILRVSQVVNDTPGIHLFAVVVKPDGGKQIVVNGKPEELGR